MRQEIAELKIEALLHDPPGKAPTLWYRSHERFADELVEMVLGRRPQYSDSVKEADRYASAVDRTALPRDPVEFRVDFLRAPKIVHPLSGTAYDLGSLADRAPEHIEQEQRIAVEGLVKMAGGVSVGPEVLYWWVWRGLEDHLASQGEIGKLWTYLPADTRIPDHSIWDHMRLTSAFAAALPKPALVLFSFGPVQTLIETARRTGDLWSGSFLLSWLAWRAMRSLVSEWGADAVLYPDLCRQPLLDAWLREERGWGQIPGLGCASRIASLPNRFLALLPEEGAPRAAERCESDLRVAAREFAEECGEEFRARYAGGGFDGAMWSRRAACQLEDILTCSWQVLPWIDEGAGLRERSTTVLGETIEHFWKTRDLLTDETIYRPNLGTFFAVQSGLVEAGHGTAKACRRFEQISEEGRRCTVCGVGEALWTTRDPVRSGRALRRGERLCGVCVVRRQAPKSDWARKATGDDVIFPSTHNLAAARFFEEVIEHLRLAATEPSRSKSVDVADSLARFIDALGGCDSGYATPYLMRKAQVCAGHAELAQRFVKLPAELLLAETYKGRSWVENLAECGVDQSCGENARRPLDHLLAVCGKAGVAPPRRYYAVLLMDGDRMGEWLSGRRGPRIREILHDAARPEKDAPYLDQKRPLSSAHQVAVSRALNQFSLEIVGRVIEGVYGGVVIYAGGDDALAMLPLHSVLPCLRDLRRLYSGLPLSASSGSAAAGFESGNGYIRRGGRLWRTMGEKATCSMGVAIAHQKWPLRHTLETARRAEKWAKEAIGRNAMGLALLKRSGGHERFGCRWGKDDSVADPDHLQALERIVSLIGNGAVSRRFAYAMQAEARLLWELRPEFTERAYWLLMHHQRRESTTRVSDQQAREVASSLTDLAAHLDDVLGERSREDEEDVTPVECFIAGLGIAEFIARGGEGGVE